MYGLLRIQPQVGNLPNEINISDGSLDSVVGAMIRLLGGGQKNDGLISYGSKVSFIQSTQSALPPKGFHFDWNRCSLPRFKATEVMKLRTTDPGLKPKNMPIVSFPHYFHCVRGCFYFNTTNTSYVLIFFITSIWKVASFIFESLH